MELSKESATRLDTGELQQFISLIYRSLLRREADQSGLEFYSKGLQDGSISEHDFVFAIVSSPEFGKRFGGLMPLVFRGIYKGLLGKEPHAQDIEGLAGIEPSAEGVAGLVKAILDRVASDDEWFQQLMKNRGLVKVLLDEIKYDRIRDANLNGA